LEVLRPRKEPGPVIQAKKYVKKIPGPRVETPKISKYRVDCNTPKVIKRKKKPVVILSGIEEAVPETAPECTTPLASVQYRTERRSKDGTFDAGAEIPPNMTKDTTRAAATTILLRMAPSLEGSQEMSRAVVTKGPSRTTSSGAGERQQTSRATATKELSRTTALGSGGPQQTPHGAASSAQIADLIRKNGLAGLPRPPSFTEPPLGIGSDLSNVTTSSKPKDSTDPSSMTMMSTRQILEQARSNWPSQPPLKVGRTLYRTILDWSIHPTVQPSDFDSAVQYRPPTSPFSRSNTIANKTLATPPLHPPNCTYSSKTILPKSTSTDATGPATTTKIYQGFEAKKTKSRRRIGFDALEEAQDSGPGGKSRPDSKYVRGPDTFWESSSKPRVREARDHRAEKDYANAEGKKPKEGVPKPVVDTPTSSVSRHRQIGFDSLDEDDTQKSSKPISRKNSFSF
jgi:hypothetical protein